MKRTAEQIQADCALWAKLWQEYVASYQKVLQESPESFSAFSAEFRERYLGHAGPLRLPYLDDCPSSDALSRQPFLRETNPRIRQMLGAPLSVH
jgi:hypothetical protein